MSRRRNTVQEARERPQEARDPDARPEHYPEDSEARKVHNGLPGIGTVWTPNMTRFYADPRYESRVVRVIRGTLGPAVSVADAVAEQAESGAWFLTSWDYLAHDAATEPISPSRVLWMENGS